jgi:hypothetical protein
MKEKVNQFVKRFKPLFKNVMFMVFIGVSLFAGFYAGSAYNSKYGSKKPTINMVKVNRSQVNLALDEHNHLIIIDKKTGKYEMFEDSVGVTIFKMYVNRIYSNQPK